jgi:hypothetical protein
MPLFLLKHTIQIKSIMHNILAMISLSTLYPGGIRLRVFLPIYFFYSLKNTHSIPSAGTSGNDDFWAEDIPSGIAPVDMDTGNPWDSGSADSTAATSAFESRCLFYQTRFSRLTTYLFQICERCKLQILVNKYL